MAKIKYYGFIGLLGFLGFRDPWYFLFFLFFLFFLATPKPAGEGGFASPKSKGEGGFASPKSKDEGGFATPKPKGEGGFATPKPKGEGGFATPKPKGEGGSVAGKSFDLIKEQAKEKEENMAKVRQFVSGKDKFSNSDIENLLGVSDASATRYLDDLEKEGVIKQVGTDGKYVYYQKA